MMSSSRQEEGGSPQWSRENQRVTNTSGIKFSIEFIRLILHALKNQVKRQSQEGTIRLAQEFHTFLEKRPKELTVTLYTMVSFFHDVYDSNIGHSFSGTQVKPDSVLQKMAYGEDLHDTPVDDLPIKVWRMLSENNLKIWVEVSYD